ncbi:tRNA(Ile)-lysidine synthetase [Saliniradius amylolyticus]|uniref:tRNA(Ile)-lysidine synthase n=1 Tax=Saliniradius amylolyticus TaxID=2183582 RepID=A0A2S2E4L9_9ALTE|nr:tRNA lysidine(34) synthetase TilS [Saliniradius amylolyticus]AWL12595.1 tRNA(Ile)-lysidine synthetase [Saliniradius amylolyticus]
MSLYHELIAGMTEVLECNEPQVLAVGYSGGVDSQVLLHLLAQTRKHYPQHRYLAVHIHHGLSPNADSWLAHCQYWAEQWQFEFYYRCVELSNQSRSSLEAEARTARYQAFDALLPAKTHVLLAQHQDDQLETVLLQLKRGAGPKGLAGMPEHGRRGELFLHRPLLGSSQAAILAYAHEHGLTWVEDESNSDPAYERNFLRQEILPLMTERWPQLAATVARSAELCGEQQALLDDLADELLKSLQLATEQLDAQALRTLPEAKRNLVIRRWLEKLSVPMPPRHLLQRLERELLGAADDGMPCLAWQDYQLRRFQQRLYCCPRTEPPRPWAHSWNGAEAFRLPDGRLIQVTTDTDEPGVAQVVLDRYAEVGQGTLNQSFKPQGSPRSKPLKQWFKLWQLPPWERSQCVWLRKNGRILALWGRGWVKQADIEPGQATLPVVVRQGGKELS